MHYFVIYLYHIDAFIAFLLWLGAS